LIYLHSSEEIQSLYDGIAIHSQLKKNQSPIESFGFFVYSDSNKVLAGCNGCILYGCLYIDSLWVDEALRHQNVGTRLITSAEVFGKEKGCLFATVNTMDWEALGFYQKQGYEVEFQRSGYAHGSTMYFLRKLL
jgi:ribosomal protein S18 acetylase RimI-like enzyme